MRWFNRHLKGQEPLIEDAAQKYFTPEQLKVFDKLPEDEINTEIQETFVAAAPEPEVPSDASAWTKMSDDWRQQLLSKSFRAWPKKDSLPGLVHRDKSESGGLKLNRYTLQRDDAKQLGPTLFVVHGADLKQAERVVVNVLDDSSWKAATSWWPAAFSETSGEESTEIDWDAWSQLGDEDPRQTSTAYVFVAPSFVGPTALSADEKKLTQIHRRFYLLGQTLEGLQARDIRQAVRAARSLGSDGARFELQATGRMAGVALYAALFEPSLDQLTLTDLPASHRDGPYFLNVSRILEMPQTVAMVAERTPIVLRTSEPAAWDYPQAVAKKLGWSDRIKIEAK
jgi:hypothetical protein